MSQSCLPFDWQVVLVHSWTSMCLSDMSSEWISADMSKWILPTLKFSSRVPTFNHQKQTCSAYGPQLRPRYFWTQLRTPNLHPLLHAHHLVPDSSLHLYGCCSSAGMWHPPRIRGGIVEAFVVSFHLGADLQQRGGLLHDAYKKRVDIIL